MEKDRGFKEMTVSDKYAMNSDGDGSEERRMAFSKLMGVRDGSGRDATKAEMLDVSKHLYFYLVKQYFEGLKDGKWDKWDEEADFPRRPSPEFQDHSSRDDAGVFDGFDFPKWADQNLINGFEGVKAVEVLGASKTKVMTWKNHLCGGGLLNSIKDAISDHVDAQGAMNDKASKNKKANILNEITVFLQKKKMFWREGREGQHLFTSDKEQQKMRKYCGKKVGGEFYILMLKPDDDESA
jgi:hypothetical protein